MDQVSGVTDSSASAYFQEMIQRRQMNQAQRIAQGVESGRVTQGEADRLGRLESKVDKLAQAAMDDGSMSGKEFAAIMHAQNMVGDAIYRVRHNGRGHHRGAGGMQGAQGADAAASGAGAPVVSAPGGAAVSGASLVGAAASNASITDGGLMADVSKLLFDIAQYRQDRQTLRIDQGAQSGSLTGDEREALSTQVSANADLISRAEEDGLVTPEEFASIMRAQNRTSRSIFRYKHNQDTAEQAQTGDGQSQGQGGAALNLTA